MRISAKLSDFTSAPVSTFAMLGFILYALAVGNSVPYGRLPANLVTSIIFLFVSIGLFAGGAAKLRKKKIIEDIPTSTIRSLAMGLVELNGRTVEICRVISPISKAECVYYMYTLEKKVQTRDGTRWQEIQRIKSDLPFYIDDSTGRVLVDPRNADLDYEPRTVTIDSSGSRRYKEWYILNNEEVFVIGTAEKSKDFIEQSRNSLTDVIRKLKHDRQSLLKFDKNNDGIIDIAEWDSAVRHVTNEFRHEEARQIDFDPLADVVVKKGDMNGTFILSEDSEKNITRKFLWRGAFSVALAVFFYIVSILMIFPQLFFE
ncbi:MAG: hypothetical protein A2297_08200 [Elusimicrobia bacterium RIFOXYB2_FULL_48_7]|nr:MAG: hypothetical protein A2297_08200 [Elusimicrobia bacterium RIFOXYB2_FULL_48_7]